MDPAKKLEAAESLFKIMRNQISDLQQQLQCAVDDKEHISRLYLESLRNETSLQAELALVGLKSMPNPIPAPASCIIQNAVAEVRQVMTRNLNSFVSYAIWCRFFFFFLR